MSNFFGYDLSTEADSDLNEIFDYTELHHGFDQAISYLIALEMISGNLQNIPKLVDVEMK